MSTINLLAENLDSRVEFKCASPRFYWNKDGELSIAAADEWPLEYSGGVAIGRHEPEPAAINYQGHSLTPLSGTGYTLSQNANMSEMDGPAGTVTTFDIGWVNIGLYSNTTSEWLVPTHTNTLSTTFTRSIMNTEVSMESSMRIYVARLDGSNYCYGLAASIPAGDVTASFFRARDPDSRIGVTLIQIESGKIATSPILTEAGATGTRQESSVTVNTSGVTSLTAYYSDGTSVNYSVSGSTYSLPLSEHNWGERYLQYLELPDTDETGTVVRCMGANGVPVSALRAGDGQSAVRCFTPGGYTVAVVAAENGQQNSVRCLSAGGYPVWVVKG